jgi:glycosyltransferase involved in cell wall biosynthesis
VRLTVLIPAYNEEATILEVLEQVRAVRVPGVDFEVIVVDDGSRDRTVALLQSRPELYTTLIRQATNGGKGHAVQTGLTAATGDYVLFQDADLEYRPSDYPKLIEAALAFDPDVVMGSRTLAPALIRVHYFWNNIGNRGITLAFNILFNTTFSDIYTCYFMFRRELIDPSRLRTMGFDQQAELLAKCVKAGKRSFYEVPITYHGRTHAEGKKIRARHVIGVFLAMARERFAR